MYHILRCAYLTADFTIMVNYEKELFTKVSTKNVKQSSVTPLRDISFDILTLIKF